ncbi:MAG TPA: hypothetical protein VNM66_06610 [Thermodesulfobacteriota bacterium]|nr:hypothetical protein [Thermodesulfobacteriota bacterium]
MRATVVTPATLVVAAAAGPAAAMEFQPVGTLGVGGAGVARPPDGTAPYWNPAALAFERGGYAGKTHAGAGATATGDLVHHVDRLGRIDFDAISSVSGDPATDRARVAAAVKAIALPKQIEQDRGALVVQGSAVFGHRVGRVGFGAYGSAEGAAQPLLETANIRPASAPGGPPVGAAEPVAVTSDGNSSSALAPTFFSAAEAAQSRPRSRLPGSPRTRRSTS